MTFKLFITLTPRVGNFHHFLHIYDYCRYKENKTFVIRRHYREERTQYHRRTLPPLTLFHVDESLDKGPQDFAK